MKTYFTPVEDVDEERAFFCLCKVYQSEAILKVKQDNYAKLNQTPQKLSTQKSKF